MVQSLLPTGTTGPAVSQIYDADHNQLAITVTQIIAALNSGNIGLAGAAGNGSMAFMGDSITANGLVATQPYGTGTNNFGTHANNTTYWTRQLSNSRFYSPNAYNFAGPGLPTSQQMTVQLQAFLATYPTPSVVWICGGRVDAANGVASGPDTVVGTTTYNLRMMYEACQAVGSLVVAIKIPSMNQSQWTTAKQQQALQTNRWIDQQALIRKGFFVIDPALVYDDPTASTWQPQSGFMSLLDNQHPTIWGAYAIGNLVAQTLATLKPDWHLPVLNTVDVFNSTGNTYGNMLYPNTEFQGVGGNIVGTGATGGVPTGWSLQNPGNIAGSGGTGGVLITSYTGVTMPAGYAKGATGWALGITGTPGKSGAYFYLVSANLFNAGGNTFAAGDTIEAEVAVFYGKTSNIAGVSLYLETVENSVAYTTSEGLEPYESNQTLPTDQSGPFYAAGLTGLNYLMRTDRRTLTAAPTYVVMGMRIGMSWNPTGSAGGTFTFAAPTIRKVPPATF